MRFNTIIRGTLLAALLLAIAAPVLQAREGAPPPTVSLSTPVDWEFHSVVPLGLEPLRLHAGPSFVLLATAESPSLEGVRRVPRGGGRVVLDRDGMPLAYFPANVSFRVTATRRQPCAEPGQEAFELDGDYQIDQLLLGLRFEAKIFHGLKVTTLEPSRVELIGMPADVPYNERIYRVDFELQNVPAEDRIVLEVLSPDGERISKFHLELL